MTNTLVTKKAMCVTDEIKSANELNDFYRRFETRDYTSERSEVLGSMTGR